MTARYLDDPEIKTQVLAGIPMARLGEPDVIGATVSFLLPGTVPYLSGATVPIAGAANL